MLKSPLKNRKAPTDHINKLSATDAAIEDEEEKVATEFLVRLIKASKEERDKSEEQPHRTEDSASPDAAAFTSLQEQYEALQLSFQAITKKLEEEMARLTTKVTTKQPSNVLLPLPAP